MLQFLASAPVEVLSFLFLLMLLYSFVGWCGEMVYCSLCQGRFCEKRGFLNGPICPIYGHGALLVLLVLQGGCKNPAATFLLGALLTSAVEYVTSFVMEKLFHMRWWDYSQRRFNLNGRICLRNSALFGAACVLLCHGPGPALTGLVARLSIRAGVAMAAALGMLYLADIVLSVRSAVQIRVRLEKLHAVQEELSRKLEELRVERQELLEAQRERLEEALAAAEEKAHAVQERLEPLSGAFARKLEAAREDARQRLQAICERQDLFERRLLSSFPSMRSTRHGEALEKLREYLAGRED